MKMIKMSFANAKIATVIGNRKIDERKLLKVIRKDGRVNVPILGVYYGTIKNLGIQLVDIMTGELIANPTDDYFVIIDGQHRTKCAMLLWKETMEEEEYGNVNEDIATKVFDDFIYANLYEEDEMQTQNVQAFIMRINSTSNGWKDGDYIESAYTRKQDDKFLYVIEYLRRLGFSLSAISRYLFFNHKRLTKEALTAYVDGNGDVMSDANLERALIVLGTLFEKNFSVKFVSKRYLIDEIIKRYNKSENDFYEFVRALRSMDEDTVNEIEHNMVHNDYDNGKIKKVVLNHFNKLSEMEKKQYSTKEKDGKDLADEIIQLIVNKVNEREAARLIRGKQKDERKKLCVHSRSKKSKASQRSDKGDSDLTLADIM